jgi:hypothetical protein
MLQPDSNTEPLADSSQSNDLLTPDPNEFLKEASFDKFRDKEGNIELAKLAKSYRGLESKLGSGDLPPETPDGYGTPEDLPEGMTPESLGVPALMEKLHKAGATKKVVDVVMGEYLSMVKQGQEMQALQPQQQSEATEKTLKEAWGNDFQKNVQLAQKAFNALADETDKANSARLASDPITMKFLAKIGKGMQEDTPAGPSGTPLPAEDLSSLMKSEAYWNNKHPDHLKVKGAVTQHFQNSVSK